MPESERKNEIVQEIIQNLNEKISDLISKGLTKEQAIKKAVDDFGNIDDLKKELTDSARIANSKKTGLSLAFSVCSFVIVMGLTLFINIYYTSKVIWFVYPVLMWPLSIYYFVYSYRKSGSTI
ncbi:MAG: permease prefix domain 1-containing protein [Velocimicrobium sp.]